MFVHMTTTKPMVRLLPKLLVSSMLLVLLGACAGTPPVGLEAVAPTAPTPRVVQQDPGTTIGQRVRWGGEIISVRNNASSTEVEVYARPLADDAEPEPQAERG